MVTFVAVTGWLLILLSRPGWASSGSVIYTDYRGQTPGTVHKITPSDLPPPYANSSVVNGPSLVDRPKGAWPQAPAGFKVELVASEPLVVDPVAIDWGPDGRMWVVEMRDYPLGLDGKGKAGGVI